MYWAVISYLLVDLLVYCLTYVIIAWSCSIGWLVYWLRCWLIYLLTDLRSIGSLLGEFVGHVFVNYWLCVG